MTFIAAIGFDLGASLYDLRLPIAIVGAIVAVIGVVVAHRLGWFAAARRHPARAGVLAVVVLIVAVPVTFYLVSPLFLRSTIEEPAPVGVAVAPSAAPSVAPVVTPEAEPSNEGSPSPSPSPTPELTPFAPQSVATGTFQGTDDFHYGSGTASIIETAPGAFTLRLEDFSVRNGPDLFVYLSPAADDYAEGALELGRLKATDGSFNYELPPGTDPADFASALIWCKQFSHLFAFATLDEG